jgi:hypothetical protein
MIDTNVPRSRNQAQATNDATVTFPVVAQEGHSEQHTRVLEYLVLV